MEPVDPREAARDAVRRAPRDAMGWILLADAELEAGAARVAQAACERALSLAPGHPEALARLGRAHWMQGRFADAATHLQAAARHAPRHPGIAVWLAHVLEDTGDAEAASEAYAQAHRLAPEHPAIAAYLLAWRRRLCDWRDLATLSTQVRGAVRDRIGVVEPFAFLSEDSTPAEQLQCARLRAADIAAQVRPLPASPRAPRDRALRVGFLSNGFGAHPTGLLTVGFIEALRAHRDVEAHLFASNVDDGSDIRRRLQAAAHVLHDVSGRPHADVAHAIRAQAIDLLFDLRGWGGGAMPQVLAMRPAPIQVNWLAFPGTSGAPWIDYVLADAFVLPDALAPYFSERVLRLPRCFQPSDTTRRLAKPPTKAELGLPADAFVYCCFNNTYKLNPASFARAMAVLAQVPRSVLWLLSGPGYADGRLRDAARAAGIDPARLVFMAKQPQAEYLSRLQHADLFLDTRPYNAHTTASDAIWAGCPVLTRPGDTFASRVAGSLNHHLGLPELNKADDGQFIATAVELGRDRERLLPLRERLAAARRDSGVFDMPAFAADFVALVERVVREHVAPGAPAGRPDLR